MQNNVKVFIRTFEELFLQLALLLITMPAVWGFLIVLGYVILKGESK